MSTQQELAEKLPDERARRFDKHAAVARAFECLDYRHVCEAIVIRTCERYLDSRFRPLEESVALVDHGGNVRIVGVLETRSHLREG